MLVTLRMSVVVKDNPGNVSASHSMLTQVALDKDNPCTTQKLKSVFLTIHEKENIDAILTSIHYLIR